MGGAATKQFGTERIPNDHFANIVATINSFNRPITVAKVYSKPDHGDIDVIVNRVQDRDFLVQRLKLHDIVKNGNVWSCVYNYADRKYQIDIIYCESKFANEWYSYGNMSLLIGRIIPEKLKFAFDGLRLRYSNVVIKSDFFEALEFLGLDVERFKHGFKHRVELLRLLGWQVWSADDDGNMLLCVPLYCKMALADGVKLYSIFGELTDEFDNDHRFGALAYGVLLNTNGRTGSAKFLTEDDE